MYVSEKEVLLTYNNNIGTAITFACEKNHDSDANILV